MYYITCKDAISDLPPRLPEFGIGDDKDLYLDEPETSYQKKIRGKTSW